MKRFPFATGDGPFLETHRGFVNTWQCDENKHMNVQFYFLAFQQASEIFALRAGSANPGARTAIVRHVRFHRELHEARPTVVRSAVVGEGAQAGAIVHMMVETESGELAATALDQPGYRVVDMPACGEADIRAALPRGVGGGPTVPVDTRKLLVEGRALVAGQSVVRLEETGTDGDLLSNAIVSRFTDAAAHVWTFAGITAEWLRETGHGRVAVETKLTRLKHAPAGSGLALISWIGAMEEKTFVLHHQIEEITTGKAVATAEIRCLVMNLETRKAAQVPPFAREAFAASASSSRMRPD